MAHLTASELLVGVYRANSPQCRVQREAFVGAILEAIPILPPDLRVARIHAEVMVELATAGRPIGAHDVLIAATALAHGYRVLTVNVRDFQRVPGLVVQPPSL
jgi:tRNA(fMet)-specific endonuclease VapC